MINSNLFAAWPHAEVLQWSWLGPDRESHIGDETRGPPGARSGCRVPDRGVAGTNVALIGPCVPSSVLAISGNFCTGF